VQASLNADYYRRPTFGGGVDDEEINTRLTLTGEAPRFRWTLQDERRFDPDGEAYTQDNFYAYTEMVPHLTLMSDARQLHWGLPPNMSSTMQLSLGQFREMTRRNDQPRQVDVFRTNFQMNLRASRIPLSGSSRPMRTWASNRVFSATRPPIQPALEHLPPGGARPRLESPVDALLPAAFGIFPAQTGSISPAGPTA
jgi:hypothetical protein